MGQGPTAVDLVGWCGRPAACATRSCVSGSPDWERRGDPPPDPASDRHRGRGRPRWGGGLGPQGAADHHGQHVMELAKDLAGANGMLADSRPVPPPATTADPRPGPTTPPADSPAPAGWQGAPGPRAICSPGP